MKENEIELKKIWHGSGLWTRLTWGEFLEGLRDILEKHYERRK